MKNIQRLALVFSIASALFSCTNLEVRMPKGPQGEQGTPGRDGLSAYEVWVKAVHDGIITYPGTTEINDFFIYLKGKDGKDGLTPQVADGKDGIPQWIFVKGQNDTVWTGVPAAGRDGKDGKNGLSAYEIWKISVAEGIQDPKNPGQTWPKDRTSTADFYKFLTGNDGDDGLTPYVGTNGNWFIGKTDTGVPATGPQGEKGATGAAGQTPHVGDNGNWFIGTKDTGVKARGPQGNTGKTGATGSDGLSAYELWVKDVTGGKGLEDPKHPGSLWPKDKTTVADFYEYLKGADGLSAYEIWVKAVTDGTIVHEGGTAVTEYFKYLKGEKGDKGADGKTPTIGGNGNWFIDGKDTGVKAQGDPGTNGLSAYELWLKDVATGTLQDPKNPDTTWPKDKTAMADFYDYLTGPKGDDGLVPYIGGNGNWFIGKTDTGVPAKGRDGLNGTDGKSAYEIWKALAQTGDLDDPHNPGTKWDKTRVSADDFWAYLSGVDGKDGKDGLTPAIGANGNWFIGKTDTGVPAKGQDGATPTVGENGNWFIGAKDTGVPAKGKDGAVGKDGLSAYELWVKDVKSAAGLEDPHNPGTKWDPAKTTPADFWRYLQGRDGKDGKSAYELWKADVLSEAGLTNPGNGVYDPAEYPNWPKSAVTLSDFWLYLKGKDGRNGADGKPAGHLVDTVYIEEAIPGKYNVAPVRAVMIVSKTDTTYEFVNPITGGEAFIVTGPGPVIIPNCKVTFTDGKGKTYTKTSNEEGYIYLTRAELPVYSTGNPSMLWDKGNKENGTKPTSFSFGTTTITDSKKIAATCKVAYRVDLELKTTKVFNGDGVGYGISTVASGSLTRIIEGTRDTRDMQNSSSRYGAIFYKYFNKADLTANNNVYPTFITNTGKSFKRRTVDGNGTDSYIARQTSGDIEPTTLSVHAGTKYGTGNARWYYADYGMVVEADQIEVPEIHYMGELDVMGKKGDNISYNNKKVFDKKPDPSNPGAANPVDVQKTNYELILGQTSFAFAIDWSTFGFCYSKYAKKDADGIWRFRRFESFNDYLENSGYNSSETNFETSRFRNSGSLNGVKIENSVGIKIKNNYHLIRNVYNNFKIAFDDFIAPAGGDNNNTVLYLGKEGKFYYDPNNQYKAKCTVGSKAYEFQAIVDGVSSPFPQP